jgi:hypothetical protein
MEGLLFVTSKTFCQYQERENEDHNGRRNLCVL